MIEFLDDSNFEDYAARYYNNACIDLEEFEEDIGRIKYIKRLFNKYQTTGELKERLIINHLIVLYNVFESRPLTKMLFFRLSKYHHYLKPFLIALQRLPPTIEGYTPTTPTLSTSDIHSDPVVVDVLRKALQNEPD